MSYQKPEKGAGEGPVSSLFRILLRSSHYQLKNFLVHLDNP